MKKMNKKGFTLVELLAVIIILGVLLIIAIPAMGTITENAKKDAFVSTAKNYISAARYMALQGDVDLPGNGKCTIVQLENIKLETGNNTKSVYDKTWKTNTAYVTIKGAEANGEVKYTYYFTGVDADSNGIALVAENSMARKDVKKGNATATALTITAGKITNADAICTNIK